MNPVFVIYMAGDESGSGQSRHARKLHCSRSRVFIQLREHAPFALCWNRKATCCGSPQPPVTWTVPQKRLGVSIPGIFHEHWYYTDLEQLNDEFYGMAEFMPWKRVVVPVENRKRVSVRYHTRGELFSGLLFRVAVPF